MNDTSWEANERRIRSFASKVIKRVRAAGLPSIELEDVVQELVFPWMKAVENYDPSKGAQFKTFLTTAMYRHVNRWLLQFERENAQAPYSLQHQTGSDEDGVTLEDAVADESVISADEALQQNEFKEELLKRCSPAARTFITLLSEPPIELYRELDALKEQAGFYRSRGVQTFVSSDITASLIFRLMGAGDVERRKIRTEISDNIRQMSRGAITL